MHSLEQKVSTRLQEMQKEMQKEKKEMQEQMQEQHTKLLAALQPLMRTTLHTQGSTSAPQTSSAAYVRTGLPDAVYNRPVPPPNGYELTDGQGTRNQEPNPPPRRSIQADHSPEYAGDYYVPPSQTRTEVRETSYAPHAQTGAGPAFVGGGDRQGESVSVFPADLVFWR